MTPVIHATVRCVYLQEIHLAFYLRRLGQLSRMAPLLPLGI
jgi:hypothetical protein